MLWDYSVGIDSMVTVICFITIALKFKFVLFNNSNDNFSHRHTYLVWFRHGTGVSGLITLLRTGQKTLNHEGKKKYIAFVSLNSTFTHKIYNTT